MVLTRRTAGGPGTAEDARPRRRSSASRFLPTASCLLPTAYCLLPTAVCLLASPIAAQEPAAPPAAVRERLPNGLTIIAQKAPRTQSIVGLIAYGAGSRHDPVGKPGTTHLLAHALLHAPTERRSAYAAEQALLANGPTHAPGLDCHAEAFADLLYVAAVTKPAGLQNLVQTFADEMRTARFEGPFVEEEKRRVLQEIRPLLASPVEILHNTALAAVFTRHPYRFPPYGLSEGVEAVTAEDLKRQHAAHCRPNNAVLVLYGNLDPAAALAQARAAFREVSSEAAPPAPPGEAEPEQTQERRIALTQKAHNAQILVAYRSVSFGMSEKAALLLVAGHLQQVLGERLHATGEATLVAVQEDLFSAQGGLLLIHVATASVKSVDAIEKKIRAAVAEVREKGLPEATLGPLRVQHVAAYKRLDPDLEQGLRGVPDPLPALVNLALVRARIEFTLAPYHANFLRALDTITPGEIRAVANQYLGEARSTIVVMTPKPDEGGK